MLIYKRDGLAYNSSSTQGVVIPKGITQSKLAEKLREKTLLDAVAFGEDLKIGIVLAILDREYWQKSLTFLRYLNVEKTFEDELFNKRQIFETLYEFLYDTKPPQIFDLGGYEHIYLRLPVDHYDHIAWDFVKEYVQWLIRIKAVYISEEHGWAAGDSKYAEELEEANVLFDSDISSTVPYDAHIYATQLSGHTEDFWKRVNSGNQKRIEDWFETHSRRWSYERPENDSRQWIITAGDSIWVYDFSLDRLPEEPIQTFPYLLDLSITSKCNRGCSYCYMDCKSDGVDGSDKDLGLFVDMLGELGLREIVLTGGEALQHEKFKDILDQVYGRFRLYSGRITLTTHDYEAFFGKNFLSYVCMLDGIAFSVDSLAELDELIGLIGEKAKDLGLTQRQYEKLVGSYNDKYETDHRTLPKIAIQIIPDFWSKEDLEVLSKKVYDCTSTILFTYVSVVFLGYKPMGRADIVVPKKSDEEMREILETFLGDEGWPPKLYIDTVFADEYRPLLGEYESYRLKIKEGVQSCFGVLNPEGKLELYPSSMIYATRSKTEVEEEKERQF